MTLYAKSTPEDTSTTTSDKDSFTAFPREVIMGWSIHQPTGVRFHPPPRCYLGYTLVTTSGGDHATLLDMEDRICHRWQCSEGIMLGQQETPSPRLKRISLWSLAKGPIIPS